MMKKEIYKTMNNPYNIRKKAVNITLDQEILDRIDNSASNIGLNRSQYINMIFTRIYTRKEATNVTEKKNTAADRG